ncbi:TetR/AcrR family transcriptional regulator [Kovacikia minuta CCNUW1]|uniref:TetR/AcrR family transcriptional regulator n=1 Tax=Kovacikia minuta TaxID=2931930 RepID=UPI001CCCE363|nr:TetR/AcrR family transcriptional regulator [Kovacikia minuta]UBF24609.1 TetR/AcrR family transcriptional regulator [Kovacikia minuta CCNUW1]
MPKIVDSEQYRSELLHKCFDLLAEKGYANVTTRQLSKELGISTGAMYHYFPSKKALFEQLVEELGRQDVAALQQMVVGANTLHQKLAALEKYLIDNEDYFIKQTAIWTDFCINSNAGEVSSNAVFKRVDEQYCQAIAAALGLSNPRVTQFIWTLINGVLLEQVSQRDSKVFGEQVHLLIEMLTAYFEKLPG